MEHEKRTADVNWSWSIAQIDSIVNDKLTAIEKDDTLNEEQRVLEKQKIEKAWQRILMG